MNRLCTRSMLAISLTLLVLFLVACGQAGSGNTTGAGVNPQAQPTSDPNTADSSNIPPEQPPEPAANTRSGGIVEGRITDAAGNPIAGVLVMPASSAKPPEAVPEIAVLTDAQGRYTWHLSPGPYTFTVTHEGYAPATQQIVVKPDQPVKLDLALQK
jgi:hypothetical protein